MLSERRSLYFSADFFPARSAFREMVATAGGQLDVLPLDATGPNGEKLAIDIGWFGVENPRRVLLHSSGLHGVEGFAGSAIQLQVLKQLPVLPEDTALILAHILNPYGMAWLRRVNENNVDLNRNSLGDEKYSGAPDAYPSLDSFLNPASPPGRDAYLLKVVCLALRYGMPALRQTVAGGQYEYPKGLFFGGKRFELGLKNYEAFLTRRLTAAERVLAIDVHTGLGKHGEDTLLVDRKDLEKYRYLFGARVAPSEPELGPAYRIRGGLESLIRRVLSKAEVLFVTQEFGTFHAIKNLHALREENRWHHYGRGTMDHPAKSALKEAFDPDDESWRQAVLNRGREVLGQALASLRGSSSTPPSRK